MNQTNNRNKTNKSTEVGSNFVGCLRKQGQLKSTTAQAIKHVQSWQNINLTRDIAMKPHA